MYNPKWDGIIPMKKGLFMLGLKNKKKKKNKRLAKAVMKKAKSNLSESESIMSVMNNEDLLLEILIRLPDFKNVIKLSSVCFKWHSLSHQPHFLQNFILHHSLKQEEEEEEVVLDSSYVLLMRGNYVTTGPEASSCFHKRTIQNIFSNTSKILFPSLSTNSFLEFFDRPKAHILSSFQDLLLLEERLFLFCVVNPITKQVVELPLCPKTLYNDYTCFVEGITYRCGFVANNQGNFKVVLITSDNAPNREFRGSIFCSETKEWSCCFKLLFPFRLYDWHPTPIGCSNGVIYWPFGGSSFQGIAAFDTSTTQCCSVVMPPEFDTTLWRNAEFGVRLGVVQGHLRLLQLFLDEEAAGGLHVLRAWDLVQSYSSPSPWIMVKDVRLKWGAYENMALFPIAFHPQDEDVIFLKRVLINDKDYNALAATDNFENDNNNVDICLYRFGRRCYEHVCYCPFAENTRSPRVLPLLVHGWPTRMPPLHTKHPPPGFRLSNSYIHSIRSIYQ
ncbi:hypothetical protein CsatA_005837 [Cannabis sativa]